ncbi:uncharacterized protein LOC142802913 [Rhipicephalus microplus]|uniref:uncharacterized protein LOC142802913 n=1 Tax=Rhipicephalus microplus TaxID=6941 RepID=UPI003F6C6FAD
MSARDSEECGQVATVESGRATVSRAAGVTEDDRMDYSKQQDLWRSQNHGLNDYVLFLAEFGATTYLAYDLASKLRGYENQLESIAKATLTGDQTMEYVFEMSFQTDPYVSLVMVRNVRKAVGAGACNGTHRSLPLEQHHKKDCTIYDNADGLVLDT